MIKSALTLYALGIFCMLFQSLLGLLFQIHNFSPECKWFGNQQKKSKSAEMLQIYHFCGK